MNDREKAYTERAMTSGVVVVDGSDGHTDSSDADRQHAPVGGKHEPDGVVVAVEMTSLLQEVGDHPNYHQNGDDHSVYNVRRRHTACRPLTVTTHKPASFRRLYDIFGGIMWVPICLGYTDTLGGSLGGGFFVLKIKRARMAMLLAKTHRLT